MKSLHVSFIVALAFFVGAVGFLVGTNAVRSHEALTQIDQIREAQIEVCEDALKPGGVRAILIRQLQDEIAESHLTQRRREELFPNIDPQEFRELIQASIEQKQRQIVALSSVDCPARYAH